MRMTWTAIVSVRSTRRASQRRCSNCRVTALITPRSIAKRLLRTVITPGPDIVPDLRRDVGGTDTKAMAHQGHPGPRRDVRMDRPTWSHEVCSSGTGGYLCRLPDSTGTATATRVRPAVVYFAIERADLVKRRLRATGSKLGLPDDRHLRM